jgi:hypothetical protein
MDDPATMRPQPRAEVDTSDVVVVADLESTGCDERASVDHQPDQGRSDDVVRVTVQEKRFSGVSRRHDGCASVIDVDVEPRGADAQVVLGDGPTGAGWMNEGRRGRHDVATHGSGEASHPSILERPDRPRHEAEQISSRVGGRGTDLDRGDCPRWLRRGRQRRDLCRQ